MKKKNISLFLACAMTVGMATSAFATSPTPNTITGYGDKTITKDADVDLKGEIVKGEVLLSVVMPTSIDFTVATSDATTMTVNEKNTNNQTSNAQNVSHVFYDLVSGTGTVTNNSNMGIMLQLTNVVDNDNLLKKMDVALASDELTKTNALANPLVAGAYSTGSEITLASKIAANGGTTDLTVVGQGAEGQFSGSNYAVDLPAGSYTVTTTLKVSVAQ